MTGAFIPKNLVIDGKWIKYADIRGAWKDGTVGIDCYYDRNFAKFVRLTEEEVKEIEKTVEVDSSEVRNLYNSVFKQTPLK